MYLVPDHCGQHHSGGGLEGWTECCDVSVLSVLGACMTIVVGVRLKGWIEYCDVSVLSVSGA